MHYRRWNVHRDLDRGLPKHYWITFFSHVDRSAGPNGCWLWTGKRNAKRMPHGQVKYEGRWTSTHRVAFILMYGKIPRGKCVCHSCDVPYCVNPTHLWLGTSKQNTQDCIRKGRKARTDGERNGASKLSCKKVAEIRNLWSANQGWGYQSVLARMYGVSHNTISNIISGHTWRTAN